MRKTSIILLLKRCYDNLISLAKVVFGGVIVGRGMGRQGIGC